MEKIILIALIFISFTVNGAERSDAFIVNIYDKSVKVISPDKATDKVSAILLNKTLSPVLGKIVVGNDTFIKHVKINSNEQKSVEIPVIKGQKTFFIPMAPAFQEVELLIGKKSYEIPPKLD